MWYSQGTISATNNNTIINGSGRNSTLFALLLRIENHDQTTRNPPRSHTNRLRESPA